MIASGWLPGRCGLSMMTAHISMLIGPSATLLKAHSHSTFFSDCDCDSSYRNKWVVQESMEVFTLCDCTTSQIPMSPIISKNKSQSQSEKSHSVNESLMCARGISLFLRRGITCSSSSVEAQRHSADACYRESPWICPWIPCKYPPKHRL